MKTLKFDSNESLKSREHSTLRFQHNIQLIKSNLYMMNDKIEEETIEVIFPNTISTDY